MFQKQPSSHACLAQQSALTFSCSHVEVRQCRGCHRSPPVMLGFSGRHLFLRDAESLGDLFHCDDRQIPPQISRIYVHGPMRVSPGFNPQHRNLELSPYWRGVILDISDRMQQRRELKSRRLSDAEATAPRHRREKDQSGESDPTDTASTCAQCLVQIMQREPVGDTTLKRRTQGAQSMGHDVSALHHGPDDLTRSTTDFPKPP